MNDDVEQRLNKLTPRGLRPNLREQVLAAVENELQCRVGQAKRGPTKDREKSWWDRASLVRRYLLRHAAMAVAVLLLLGVGLNLWASKASEQRLARLFGPPPISKRAMEIAKDVERITDAETGQWVYRQLTMPRQPGDAAAAYTKYRDAVNRLIDELQTVSKDTYHEASQKDSEMDRGHTGCLGGDRFDCQRRVRLDHWRTA